MGRKIIWSDQALKDVESIAEFIEKDSPSYASSFVLKIIRTVGTLDELTERGRTVPEFNNKSIKELFIGEYRIIYKIGKHSVDIVSIIHGRRDWK